ncbi:hypothetical protein [Nonomuraea typhae]|uniref:Uncharacterized protein n=1 Tax=Nonomuraea typhae TaxID=2603600 RepID=A0ABW7Z913_9ACTN
MTSATQAYAYAAPSSPAGGRLGWATSGLATAALLPRLRFAKSLRVHVARAAVAVSR